MLCDVNLEDIRRKLDLGKLIFLAIRQNFEPTFYGYYVKTNGSTIITLLVLQITLGGKNNKVFLESLHEKEQVKYM